MGGCKLDFPWEQPFASIGLFDLEEDGGEKGAVGEEVEKVVCLALLELF